MAQADLKAVTNAARQIKKAERKLIERMQKARASGESFRDIAKAAGLSHQQVANMLRKAEDEDLASG
jgi:DNA-binding Lrp family transcriptional regulator